MDEFRTKFADELKRLEVSDEEEVTAKILSTKFKKKALKVHPDKNGEVTDDEEFKTLLNDYKSCMDALSLLLKDEVDKEKNDMAEFFAKNNVTKENTNSYTVLIENEMNGEWKDAFKKMKLSIEPMKLKHGGTQYKTEVLGNIVSLSHYENPSNGQSKLLIQGNMFHIKTFIIENLPLMYQKMSTKIKKRDLKNVKPKQNVSLRALNGKEITFNCDQCDVTYRRKFYLEKHIRDKHDQSQAKKIEKALKAMALPINSMTTTAVTYKTPKGLSIIPFTKHDVQDIDVKAKETAETTLNPTTVEPLKESPMHLLNKAKTEATKQLKMNTMEETTVEPLRESLKDLGIEFDNLLDILQERAEDVVKEKSKEAVQESTKKAVVDFDILDITELHDIADVDEIGEQTGNNDITTLISQLITEMADKAIVLPNWVQKEPTNVTNKSIEVEIFKEFEESKENDHHNSFPEDVFVCGECGIFSCDRSKLETHMNKSHSDKAYEELQTENRKHFKDLCEAKSLYYELQTQLEEAEQTIANTMKENLRINEDNDDKAKIIDRLLDERSTVDQYDEDGEELGFWKPNEEESDQGAEVVDKEEREPGETRSVIVNNIQCTICDFVATAPKYMKSHILLKHKEVINECLKCKKKFATTKHLNEHIQKAHHPNLYPCNQCEAKFLAAHALKQHIQAVHKELQPSPIIRPERTGEQTNVQQRIPTNFKCKKCKKGHSSGALLDKHLAQCTQSQGGEFRLKECRNGPECHFFTQNRCIFYHPVMQQNQQNQQRNLHQNHPRQNRPHQRYPQQNRMPPQQHWPEPCRRGPACTFWAAGTCYYSHENFPLQDMWQQPQQPNQHQQTQQRKACRYMEDCNRVPYCPFRHYNEDFPELRKSSNKN